MTRIIQSELKHLPKGIIGSPQNELRKIYNIKRRHDIVSNINNEDTLRFCINNIKNKHPDFIPKYDETFFRIVEKKSQKNIIQRIKDWRKHSEETKSVKELLKAIVDEKEKTLFLENEMIKENEKFKNLEIEIRNYKQSFFKNEKKIILLENELKSALEECLLLHIKERKGKISIKDYARNLNIRESILKEVLENLVKKGKIRIE